MSNKSRGVLTVVCGPMYSGKSEELIRRRNRLMPTQRHFLVLKSDKDTRWEGVRSRNLLAVPDVTLLAQPSCIIDAVTQYEFEQRSRVEYVLIDEVQFLAIEDYEVVEMMQVTETLLAARINVVALGLDLNFKREPFPVMKELLPRAQEVQKLTAVCFQCKSMNAVYTQRLIAGKPAPYNAPVVSIGDVEQYEARCPDCHELPDCPEEQWQREFRTIA